MTELGRNREPKWTNGSYTHYKGEADDMSTGGESGRAEWA